MIDGSHVSIAACHSTVLQLFNKQPQWCSSVFVCMCVFYHHSLMTGAFVGSALIHDSLTQRNGAMVRHRSAGTQPCRLIHWAAVASLVAQRAANPPSRARAQPELRLLDTHCASSLISLPTIWLTLCCCWLARFRHSTDPWRFTLIKTSNSPELGGLYKC